MVLMSLCRDPYVVLVNYDLINSLTPTFLHAVGAVRRAMAAMRKKPRALDGHSVVAPLALAKALAAVPPSRRGGRVSNLSIKTHDRLCAQSRDEYRAGNERRRATHGGVRVIQSDRQKYMWWAGTAPHGGTRAGRALNNVLNINDNEATTKRHQATPRAMFFFFTKC